MAINPNVRSRLFSDYLYLGVCVFTLVVLVGSMAVIDGVEVPSEEPAIIEGDSNVVSPDYDVIIENGEVSYRPVSSVDYPGQEDQFTRQ